MFILKTVKLISKPYSCILKRALSLDNTQAEVIGSSNTYGLFHEESFPKFMSVCLLLLVGSVTLKVILCTQEIFRHFDIKFVYVPTG